MFEFLRTLLKMPKPWLAWLAALVAVNMILPLRFIATLEGKVVLGALMLGVVLQTVIFCTKGFVRLLGLGHIAWIPLVLWLWTRLEPGSYQGLFSFWLVGTIILNSISLVIDVVDVWRYVNGDRAPQIEA